MEIIQSNSNLTLSFSPWANLICPFHKIKILLIFTHYHILTTSYNSLYDYYILEKRTSLTTSKDGFKPSHVNYALVIGMGKETIRNFRLVLNHIHSNITGFNFNHCLRVYVIFLKVPCIIENCANWNFSRNFQASN